MKNVHILPTDKPSRLSILNSGKLNFGAEIMSSSNSNPQNIYITSDEEITGFEINIWVIKGDRIFLWQNTMALVSNNKPKKIILTTDQDLIKDGVQAIDDTFLEWFVKNLSCEEVEVKNYKWSDYPLNYTPKEKAAELYDKMNVIHYMQLHGQNKDSKGLPISMYDDQIKQCALIAVDEIIKVASFYNDSQAEVTYFKEVRKEIENLWQPSKD